MRRFLTTLLLATSFFSVLPAQAQDCAAEPEPIVAAGDPGKFSAEQPTVLRVDRISCC